MEGYRWKSDGIGERTAWPHIGYDQQHQSIRNICIIQEHIQEIVLHQWTQAASNLIQMQEPII